MQSNPPNKQCVSTGGKPEDTLTGILAAGIYFQYAHTYYVSDHAKDKQGFVISLRLPLAITSDEEIKSAFENEAKLKADATEFGVTVKSLFEQFQKGVKTDTTANVLESFEQGIKIFFSKLVDAAKNGMAKCSFLKVFYQIFASDPSILKENKFFKKGFLKLTEKIGKVIASELSLVNLERQEESFIGLDIEKIFGETGVEIRLVKHSYTYLKGEASMKTTPIGPIDAVVQGSYGLESTVQIL